jgi:hypothetical protein
MWRGRRRSTYMIKMFGNKEVGGKILDRKWLIANESITYARIINSANSVELKYIEEYLRIKLYKMGK